MQSRTLAPPYSIILVMDPSARNLPSVRSPPLVCANSSAVAIGTLAEISGETEVRLGLDSEVDPGTTPEYVGQLDTPSGVVSVRTAETKEVLSLNVNRPRVTLRVWVNDSSEPDVICVGVS